jgi:hypothetical protein
MEQSGFCPLRQTNKLNNFSALQVVIFALKLNTKRNNMPNPIEWTDDDKWAVTYYLMGFSNKYIEQKTLLTPGRVIYRVKVLNLNGARAMFRNGEGIIAHFLQRKAKSIGRSQIERELTKLRDKGRFPKAA